MLEFDNRTVHVATSAKQALELCEKEAFDVIIVDFLMPVVKGDELALTLKERFPDRPVIMITADSQKMEAPDEKPPGVDLLIGKPFRLDDLRGAINSVFPKP
jgi:two-component system NtrC family response regulator